jgi:hypothetical protein
MVNSYPMARIRRIMLKTKLPKNVQSRIRSREWTEIPTLSLCHIDINVMNVILDESTNIVGLVDWKQAQLSPVGMNAWCTRYLAVPISHGVDQIAEKLSHAGLLASAHQLVASPSSPSQAKDRWLSSNWCFSFSWGD